MTPHLRAAPRFPAEDRALLRGLKALLVREGYLDSYHVFGPCHLRFDQVRQHLDALPGRTAALLSLFLLGQPLPDAAAAEVLGSAQLSALRRLGLLTESALGIQAGGKVLLPVDGLLVLLPAAQLRRGAAAEAMALQLRLSPPRGARCAALHAGSGIQALRAAALGAHVVVPALDPSTVACIELSAALNGLEDRIELRAGDPGQALHPGERFDFVSAAPLVPFVPELLGEVTGLLAPRGTARIIATSPERLDGASLRAELERYSQEQGLRIVMTLPSLHAAVLTVSRGALHPGLLTNPHHLRPGGFHDRAARLVRDLPVIEEVCLRHGLPIPRAEDFHKVGEVVLFAGPGHVVKLVAAFFRPHFLAERAALGRVHGALGVPTPFILADGEIAGWSYLILERLPGQRLAAVFNVLSREDLLRIATQLGQALRRLHALPSEGLSMLPSCPAGAWPPVLLHGDVSAENILVMRRGDAWEISGLLDFGDARLGCWEDDLVVPRRSILCGEPDLLDAFSLGYGRMDPRSASGL